MDEKACFTLLRSVRWAEGVACPSCNATNVVKDGKSTEAHEDCQKYKCNSCEKKFDDLTDTIFSNSKLPLKTWLVCLYLMGLNISNAQIAEELDVSATTAQRMTEELRAGIAKKNLIFKLVESLR